MNPYVARSWRGGGPDVLAAARAHAPAASMRETYEERRSGGRDRTVWPRHGIARETGSPPHQNHRRDGMVPRNGPSRSRARSAAARARTQPQRDATGGASARGFFVSGPRAGRSVEGKETKM